MHAFAWKYVSDFTTVKKKNNIQKITIEIKPVTGILT
tara:strand:+ start:4247 stop:4357 length:111 start_codon:yes stop_codon:yes gene_type:complete